MSPLLQQPYIMDLAISQHMSWLALDIINTVSDSIVELIATLLQVVDYTISYELTRLLARVFEPPAVRSRRDGYMFCSSTFFIYLSL